MFDHVTIRVSALAPSEAVCSTVLRTLGVQPSHHGEPGPRPQYGPGHCGAYGLDPEVEAVDHNR